MEHTIMTSNRVYVLLLLAVLASACGSSLATSPTPSDASTSTPAATPPPGAVTPIARANIQLSAPTGLYDCTTGVCVSFTYPVQNFGPGCATNVQVVTRFYGADGTGPQIGADVPMGLSDGSLSSVSFQVGTTVTLRNMAPFDDIRSAHTAFRVFSTWTNVACQ
jgi:hypothetical protein